jgi:hypothetical protein
MVEIGVEMKLNRTIQGIAVGIFLSCWGMPETARADTQTVNVVQVGGQAGNLFVVLSSTVGDPPCPGTRLILPATAFANADSFHQFYAAVLTALSIGGKLTVSVSGCYSTYPSMLTSDFWFMQGG